jgi:predicted kinase
MKTLFSEDTTSLDFTWMMERVNRCYEKIWRVSEQILAINGSVILDLGFTTRAQRDIFYNLAKELEINPEIHYLDAPKSIGKLRVDQRNLEKDPSIYAFEVIDMMFDFMGSKFEAPDHEELAGGCKISG